MDEQTEVQISRLAAAAAQQLLQKNQAEAAQQKAQQMQQDPLVQMQQQGTCSSRRTRSEIKQPEACWSMAQPPRTNWTLNASVSPFRNESLA
jgi:ribosomal protein L17